MRKVRIDRREIGDDGTFGRLFTEGFECAVLELPPRDNAPGLSCIPEGVYICLWTQSSTRKNADGSREWTFRLIDVPMREGILIHSGNFAGDKTRGYASDVEGCILVGQNIAEIEISLKKKEAHPEINRAFQRGVTSSRDTLAALIDHIGKDPFELTINDPRN